MTPQSSRVRSSHKDAQNVNLAPLDVIIGVDGPAIVNAQVDKIEYDNNVNDIIAVANINQGGAPQLQLIVKINNTDNNANTNNDANNCNDDNDSSNDDNNSVGDGNESIKTSVSNSD
jgi:hypothetical protein